MGGVGLMAWRLPRQWSNQYLLMLIWAGTGIYMALSAVRFMYNATPVFAILGGWIIWGIVDKTHFSLKAYRERWRKFKTCAKTVANTHTSVSPPVTMRVDACRTRRYCRSRPLPKAE